MIDEDNMKTNKTLLQAAATIVALSFAYKLTAQEPITRAKAPTNPAILASPRAIEVFPWLARSQSWQVERKAEPAKSNREPIAAEKNRALASSPRVLEQFPELSRAPRPEAEPTSGLSKRPILPASLLSHKALASSPRVAEEFPELARRGSRAEGQAEFYVAPLK